MQLRAVSMVGLGVVLAPTRAEAAFWDRGLQRGATVGVSLVVRIGPATDRARFGVAVDAGLQGFWHETPYGSPALRYSFAPLVATQVRLGWNPPVTWVAVVASAGMEYPLVMSDGGWVPGLGVQAGGGFGVSSDGFAGPVVMGTLRLPMAAARLESGFRRGEWHGTRASLGPDLALLCCSYYF